ncbi:oxidoreductase [Campylobacter sp. MIT 12-8780]|uniref:SDR family NAD(P)-dependent oxidoreductase n=1 Tax=unclassified Campylobacter TaxID=2593542 RepID=UPI00115C6084|nr:MULTISPECIES: SDR family oxidoreductase [unclassified Campylobacter]NDJ27597.1 SDR family oxidoreductase [Campylobacter sp. MIT 19-121]TQR40878.1 oxidoreductase [Campylobacter sp. MIT 12-8780]
MHYTLITGASSGLGEAFAKVFAKEGHNLILVARREERLERLKQELSKTYANLQIITLKCDLSKENEVLKLYENVRQYDIRLWINNAGFGDYSSVAKQDLSKISQMIELNIKALTILSTLYVRDYEQKDACLINISSAGGYTIVPNAVSYCASKFYVSSFSEGLALELKDKPLKVKVLAPAATKTEFGALASGNAAYDYDASFAKYHTSEQMAEFLLQLYKSDKIVGWVDRKSFEFRLQEPRFDYAGQR